MHPAPATCVLGSPALLEPEGAGRSREQVGVWGGERAATHSGPSSPQAPPRSPPPPCQQWRCPISPDTHLVKTKLTSCGWGQRGVLQAWARHRGGCGFRSWAPAVSPALCRAEGTRGWGLIPVPGGLESGQDCRVNVSSRP